MHNAFLVIGDARMGKSEGNLVTLSQLEERGVSAAGFRYLCQTALYRMPLSFTAESLQSAQNSLRGLVDFGRNAQAWPVKDAAWTEPFRREFRDAIADDLNVPQGLAAVWSLVREGNQRQDRTAWDTILDLDRVLGLGLKRLVGATSEVPSQVAELVAAREEARKAKDWAESDRLRQQIGELGFLVEDTPAGARVKPRP
jgi:cysteinyl-tRNA synthetase